MLQLTDKPNKRHAIQPKLKIGQPGDKYEREADAVADRVMSMPESNQMQMQPIEEEEEMMQPKLRMQPEEEEEEAIQMQSDEEEEETIQMKCVECEREEMMQPKLQMQAEEEEEEMIQPKIRMNSEENLQKKPSVQNLAHSNQYASDRIDQKINNTKGSGEVLPDEVGAEMGRKIGADFSNVKIHADSHSMQMNKELGARAFTHGSDIYFNQGQYNPQTSEGKRLLGHELTHVVQQGAVIPNHAESSQNFLQGKVNIQKESEEELLQIKVGEKEDRTIQAKLLNVNGVHNHQISSNKSALTITQDRGKERRIPNGINRFVSPPLGNISRGGNEISNIQRTIGDGHDFPAASGFSGNVILEAVFDNERALRNGSRGGAVGTAVRLVQQTLVGLGYALPRFGDDGDFGDETERAVRAFQVDVGLGVDGVVGHRTIDFLDKRNRGAEVAPPIRPVIANAPFNLANAIVQPGAAPSRPLAGLGAGVWGFTFPENVEVRIDVFLDAAAGVWQPVLSEVVGNYSLQTRLLTACPLVAGTPPIAEVTGPGGNTNAGNYCAQINDLNALTLSCGNWFMLSAVLEHERVHASRFRNGLIDPTVITPLETAIEGITIPAASAATPAAAEALIRANLLFPATLTAAQANWLTRILVLVGGDHAGGAGPAYQDERIILNPMIARICAHARSQGWPACPPLCP